MNRKVRRVLPRNAPPYFTSAVGLAVFPTKLLYAGCVRPAVGAHPCARQCSVALHRGRRAVAVNCDPPVVNATKRVPMRRPARRLYARRYVKEQRSHCEWNDRIIPYRADGRKVCKKEIMTLRIQMPASTTKKRTCHYHSSLSRRCSFTASPFHSSLPTRSEKSYFGFSSSIVGI